jgi:N-acetylneuraminic acid mutarotase
VRSSHALTYDTVRSRVVLFGGVVKNESTFGDTWEWDGDSWTQVADTGPRPRHGHAACFDSVHARVLLFGGEANSKRFGDTWAWDGKAWTQVADSGPTPRSGHAMCFEEGRGRAILFGGSDIPDTWSWGGKAWTQLNDVGPPPAENAGLVATGRSTILFGGYNRAGTSFTDLINSTWELIDAEWTERQNMGPTGRSSHGLAYDTTRERIVLFGGRGWPDPEHRNQTGILADTWELPYGPEP